MNDVARTGRTVLFVSHNMAAIQALCQRAVLLDGGHLVVDGEKRSVVRHYLSAREDAARVELTKRTDRNGDGTMRLEFVNVEAADKSGPIVSTSGISTGRVRGREWTIGLLRHEWSFLNS
jgi:lipopolysaccharide transport system ATP-binding protein